MRSFGVLGGIALGAVVGLIVTFIGMNVVGAFLEHVSGATDGGPGEAMFYWSIFLAPVGGLAGAVAGAWFGTRGDK
jgi:hypothetical protein